MDVYFTVLPLSRLYELDRIVENAGNVLCHVISQMVRLVDDSIFLHVVFREIGRAVDNMGNSDLGESFFISSDEVGAKIHEIIDNLRADAFPELVFILFPRSTVEIEVLVIDVIRVYLVRVQILLVSVPTLALGARRLLMVVPVSHRGLVQLIMLVRNLCDVIKCSLARVLFAFSRFLKMLLLNILSFGEVKAETQLWSVTVARVL